MKILLLLLLLGMPHKSSDCFNLLFSNGLKAYNNREFSTALQKLTAARDCPDKPKSTDLEDWILKAQKNLRERKAWNRARRADSPESYQRYLDDYKEGYYSSQAKEALENLQKMAAQPVQETGPAGKINWTEEYIEANGQCAIDRKRFEDNEAQAILMATRGAEVVAKANLLETAEGVQLQRSTTIKDLLMEQDIIQTKLDGIVKGTRMVGEPIVANGMVKVTLQMPLFGSGSIAEAVKPSTPTVPKPTQDLPDSTAKELVLQLPAGTTRPRIHPSFVDERGNLLLDVAASSRQHPEPVIRYIHPEDASPAVPIIEISEDAEGRWVLPTDAIPAFQSWLNIRAAGGETLPIRVIL